MSPEGTSSVIRYTHTPTPPIQDIISKVGKASSLSISPEKTDYQDKQTVQAMLAAMSSRFGGGRGGGGGGGNALAVRMELQQLKNAPILNPNFGMVIK